MTRRTKIMVMPLKMNPIPSNNSSGSLEMVA